MPETEYYESYRRDRDRDLVYSDDDDDRYKKTTVHRYKVGSDRVERVNEVDVVPRRGRHGRQSSNSLLDVDRREYIPDRPRSAFEVSEVSRRSERDRDYYNGRDDVRTVEKRRDVFERDGDDFGAGRNHRVVYEKTKEIDRERPRDRDTYTRIQRRGDHDDQIVVESYSEDLCDDGHGGEVERWHRETEYYEPAPPPPQPIIIRNRPAEQKIIVQEAPALPPVIVPHQQPGVIVIREKDRNHEKKEPRHDDEYYYERRERREVGPYRGSEREEETTIEHFDRRDDRGRLHRHNHHRDHRDYASDGDYSEDDDYYVKKTTVIRHEPSRSSSNHRLHLAEGALAGAGLGALVGSRRNNQTRELPEHRGRKVLAGAALGAIGTEVLKRAHSAYNERFGDNDDDYNRARSRSRGGDDGNRSRSTSRHHSKLKTGLGIAAAALAVAGAAKYMQSNRVDKEERNRGRSLHRFSSDDDSYHGSYRSRSLSRNSRKSRSRSVAKVAAGTAAVAGIVHHFRSKSRQREGKARSHSRLRTGAEIAAAGLAGAAAKKFYDKRKDKKEHEREEREDRELEYSDEYDDDRHGRRSVSHSRSRSRSAPPPLGATRAPYPPSAADAELGLVEYGAQPLYSDPLYSEPGHQPDAGHRSSYDSATDASRRDTRDYRRQHRRRHRSHHSQSSAEGDVDDADVDDSDRDSKKRNRSRSRLRNLAAAGAGAAAAAIGIKKYEDKKKKRDDSGKHERDRNKDHDKDYDRDHGSSRSRERDADLDRYRRRDKHHRHRDEDDAYDGYYGHDDSRPPSPPHASGGAYYPPAPPMGNTGGIMNHPNSNLDEVYPPYSPEYTEYPPPPGPPPGPPAPGGAAATTSGGLHHGPIPDGPILGSVPGSIPGSTDTVQPPSGPPSMAQQAYDPTIPPVRDADSPIVQPRQQPPHDGDHVSFALPLSQHNTAASFLPPDSSRLSKDSVNKDSTRWPLSDDDSVHDATSKAVGFAPLSPKSSRTMRRHHAQVNEHSPRSPSSDTTHLHSPSPQLTAASQHDDSRSLTLPIRRRRANDLAEDDSEEIEELPNRFDSHGRPLSDGDDRRRHSSLTTRRGDFEYRNPYRHDGFHVHGQWGVAGTDPAGVDSIAETVQDIVGRFGGGSSSSSSGQLPGFIGLIGTVLEGLSAINKGSSHWGNSRGTLEDANSGRLGLASDDDRKRKRRNTYDTNRGGDMSRRTRSRERQRNGDTERSRGRNHDQRSASRNLFTDGYFFDHDGFDGQDTRKRRRSWAS